MAEPQPVAQRPPCCTASARDRFVYICDSCGLLNLNAKISVNQARFLYSLKRHVWLVGPQGEGKCLAKGTLVIMFDGSRKAVEDIVVGDRLMGPDSEPRTVQALGHGQEEMLEVVPFKGDPFTCNQSHILTLQRSDRSKWNKRDGKAGEWIDISIRDYLKSSRTFKHNYRLVRASRLHFARTHRGRMDPYWLGLWLGDGTSVRPEITTADREVQAYLRELSDAYNVKLSVRPLPNNQSSLCTFTTGRNGGKPTKNPFMRFLRAHDLINRKHIPPKYMTGTRSSRLLLLAGLIDSDGWVNRTGYQLTFKSQRLADDVVFLARSLGFATYIKPSRRTIKSRGFIGQYWRISIDGSCHEIPIKIPRKRVPVRASRKNVLLTGIKEIRPKGIGEYFGFTLKEGPHFLLGDCTVTHNTFISILAMLVHTGRQVKQFHPLTGEPMPSRWAFIRDTHSNIKRISVPAFKKNFPGIWTFRDDYHIGYGPGIEVDMFGMDRSDDLGKIQGAEYDGIHLEEPAPIIAQGPSGPIVNAGMSREVFQVAATRMRGGKTKKRLQIGMNPADRSHWTFYEREMNPEWESMTEVIRMRPGENPHISAEDRQAVRAAYADRPDLMKRYVLGIESEVYPGIAITPEYNSDWHKAAFELKPILGAENFLMFDGGLNATCTLGQLTPAGRFHLLDCVSMDNGGMYQLLKTKLIPLLKSPRWAKIRQFRATGDASLVNREQGDSNYSAAHVINTMLQPWLRSNAFEPGVQDWELRRESLKDLLETNVGGLPKLLVNPTTTQGEPYNRIHAALAGGYCYKLVNGVVQRDKPDKNRHCLPLDFEILTMCGWKTCEQLTVGEKVYGYDLKTDAIRPSLLKAIHRFQDGPYSMLSFQSRTLDLVCTFEHQCVVTHKYTAGIRLVPAAEMNTSDFILRSACDSSSAKPWFSDDFIRLCAWVMAEGSYKSGRSGAVTITQSATVNEPYCHEIDRLVSKFRGRFVAERTGGVSKGRIRTWQLSGEMAELLQFLMPGKIAGTLLIRRMTNRQRRLFLWEFVRGDGHWRGIDEHIPSPGKLLRNRDFHRQADTPVVFQKSKEAIDVLQMIGVLAGLRVRVRPSTNGSPGWLLTISREGRKTSVSKLAKTIISADAVWCPETEHGTWIARRNGLAFITGNSHIGDSISHSTARIFQAPLAPDQGVPDTYTRQRRATGYAVGGSAH